LLRRGRFLGKFRDFRSRLLLRRGRFLEEFRDFLRRLHVEPREEVVAFGGLSVAAHRAVDACVALVRREVSVAALAVYVTLFRRRCSLPDLVGGGGLCQSGGSGGGRGNAKQRLANTAASWVAICEAVEVSSAFVAVRKLLLGAVFAASWVAALGVIVPHLTRVAVREHLLAVSAQREVVLYQAVECASAFAAIGGPQELVPVHGGGVGGRHVGGGGGGGGECGVGSGCGKLYFSGTRG